MSLEPQQHICIKHFKDLLRAYVSFHRFDIIFLPKTYLGFSVDGKSLEISGY